MAKTPIKYYQVDPWMVEEKGFDKTKSEVSESIFCLANEYMGVRGFFDETYQGNSLIGTYFNGIYEEPPKQETGGYRGISHKSHFMVNAVNWLKTDILVNDEILDLNKVEFSDFSRSISFKSGELVRTFIYKNIKFTFSRFLDMVNYHQGYQKIIIEPLNEDINLKLVTGLDYQIKHWHHFKFWKVDELINNNNYQLVRAHTKKTKQRIYTAFKFNCNYGNKQAVLTNNQVLASWDETITKEKPFILIKKTSHLKSRDQLVTNVELVETLIKTIDNFDYQDALNRNIKYWNKVWENNDIIINGDAQNQQGIRFCIFQMQQTLQGIDPLSNIGAKGLTGEAYSGHAFWDTETCCLPFFLLNNPPAARDLLLFRYHTLPQAKLRAKELDCEGACYPIATLNGNEACNLWQHASLQFQPTTGVCFGIYHYVNVTKDIVFLYDYGAEMLIETSRFLMTRGSWNNNHTKFGYYGVMGPDEFQMMVNHNVYTNYMAKRSLMYTVETLKQMEKDDNDKYQILVNKCHITDNEIKAIEEVIKYMVILYDDDTKLFEQHQGYYDLPHIEIDKIPVSEFPLYDHWSYDRLYRNDMIKQPDVLMMMYLYNQSFTYEQKLNNYNFYEPRTIHESSLSPSIHSVLALELGKLDQGLSFFGYATRMDLDDYNRNTKEGIHITSIASAWANIVYGFGGVRTDGELLKIAPCVPNNWQSYQFKMKYLGCNIKVNVDKKQVVITTDKQIGITVYQKYWQIEQVLIVELPHDN